MPAWLYRKHLPLIWDGWNSVEGDPPAADEGGGGAASGDPGLAEWQAKAEGLQKALENSRQFEKRYKKLEAILGDVDPDRLMKLREAENNSQRQAEEMERRILEAKNAAASEYEQQLQQAAKERQDALTQLEQVELSNEVLQAFGKAQGSSSEFQGFMTLAGSLFHRTDSGLQVKDAAGKLITTKDESGQIRAANPAEFMNLLVQGKLDNEYQIPSINLLKMAFTPYNKARGAGLPSGNGAQPSKPFSEMSQAELAQYAFKR